MARPMHFLQAGSALLACGAVAVPALGGDGWVDFVNETTLRLPTPLNNPATTTTDPEEKAYSWGDLDHDGDIDLVVGRKQPFTTSGKKINVLLMNEGIAEGHSVNGVLVDRTSLYAQASDIPGDLGFNTPTCDRDIIVVDVDNDGWKDVVTGPALTDNQAKHISHPRIYYNLGESGGAWLGLQYQDARIPQIHPTAGPRLCAVGWGDVTGDGFADIYLSDYDSGPPEIMDWNDKLLVNNGNGFFLDQTNARLTPTMASSGFAAANAITDYNGDGMRDVMKHSVPTVSIIYNDDTDEGFFNGFEQVYSGAGYFASTGDLNGDAKMDIVVSDDGSDRFLLNQGNGLDGFANFLTLTFPSGPSSGFGGNSIVADLNNDMKNDVLITDVDVDIPGCGGRMHIYRNNGVTPNPAFNEEGEVIPNGMLTGTHDVAVFDINNDGWLDVVVGRCTGTQVWMNQPPNGLVYTYPDGNPLLVDPGAATTFPMQVTAFGGGTPLAGSADLFVTVGDPAENPFSPGIITHLGGNLYDVTLPAAACTEQINFYITSDMQGGGTFTDPAGAPATYYTAVAATGTEITLRDDIEDDTSDWTIVNGPGLTAGAWQQADPNGTLIGINLAAPEDDATNGDFNLKCFVTQNGLPGGEASADDVDGGATHLISPAIDLDNTDATLSFARWYVTNDGNDEFVASISNNGGQSWIPVNLASTTGGSSGWKVIFFVVSDYVTPTSTVQMRFTAQDTGVASIVEAGIDNFQIEEYACTTACAGDGDGSGDVGFSDLTLLLLAWGPCGGCPLDLDDSGDVGFSDLTLLLLEWGPCD